MKTQEEKEKKEKVREFAANLRRIARTYLENPDLPMPHGSLYVSTYGKKTLALAARAFGEVEKSYDDYNIAVRVPLGGNDFLEFYTSRASVCKSKQVGTKKEMVREVADVTYRTVEREVPILEWDCGSILSEKS
jgi:hypothetical protein